MKKEWNLQMKGVISLSETEMKQIRGGGLIDTVGNFVMAGLKYFYHMGVTEARLYKSQL